jgi:hypothetical protein
MKFRGFIAPLALLTILGACLAVTISIQRDAIAKLRRVPPFLETWELAGRSGNAMKYMTLRYDGVAADFLWLRAIQSFGGRGMTNRDWVPLYNLFDAITELDPYFEAAYTFGNLVIGDEGGHQREGLRLLDKGTERAYRRYRPPFEGLYVSQWALKEPRLAAWYGRVAKKRPDAPDWLPRIVAYVEIASGEYYIGYDRYLRNLLEAVDQNSVVLQDISLNKTAETLMYWNSAVLGEAIDRYTSATGTLPSADMHELANDPILAETELGSFPHMLAAINLLAKRLNKDRVIEPGSFQRAEINTRAVVQAMAQAEPDIRDEIMALDLSRGNALSAYQQDIFRLSLRKQRKIPFDPYGYGMAINLTYWDQEDKPVTERVTTKRFIQEETMKILAPLRASIERRKKELNRNPVSLNEVFFTDFNTTEPLGGQWLYNPEDGTVRSSSFPDL